PVTAIYGHQTPKKVITDTTQANTSRRMAYLGCVLYATWQGIYRNWEFPSCHLGFSYRQAFQVNLVSLSSQQNWMNWSKTTVVILQHISVSFIQNML
ncbi:MAG: hypothetical protein QF358_12315, partial [Arenicellales bacterium]|nr:hypothetical protein [Arenicellales bacterium]